MNVVTLLVKSNANAKMKTGIYYEVNYFKNSNFSTSLVHGASGRQSCGLHSPNSILNFIHN